MKTDLLTEGNYVNLHPHVYMLTKERKKSGIVPVLCVGLVLRNILLKSLIADYMVRILSATQVEFPRTTTASPVALVLQRVR